MARAKKPLYASLAANIGIAAVKFIAGSVSKSSSMISEGVHSAVDCFNELFLLLGIVKSNRKKDKSHPFGYGRELYFWSFIVSILIFGLGAGISFFQGIQRLRHPLVTGHFTLNYIVAGISFLFDGWSLLVALKHFDKREEGQSWWAAIKDSKDPSDFIILLENAAAVLGIVIVAGCIFIGQVWNVPYADGIGSILIGVILTWSSAIVAIECRSLLMGEGISAKSETKLIALIKKDKYVVKVERVFSIYLSPEEILLMLVISFENELKTADLDLVLDGIKKNIRDAFPRIVYIIIQPGKHIT